MFSILFKKDIKIRNIFEIRDNFCNLSPILLFSFGYYNYFNNESILIKLKKKKFLFKKIKLDMNPFKSYIFNYYSLTSVERSSNIILKNVNHKYLYKNNLFFF